MCQRRETKQYSLKNYNKENPIFNNIFDALIDVINNIFQKMNDFPKYSTKNI